MDDNLVIRNNEEFYNIRFLQKYLLETNGFIAGGCFKNIFNHEKVKDIDVFFRSKDDYSKAVSVYRLNKEFDIYYENRNVTAFKEKSTGIVIELIRKGYYDPKSILNDFDFSIAKFCYFFELEEDEEGGTTYEYTIIHHKDFFEHLQMKKLVIDSDKLLYPFGVFERALRYSKYGYTMCRKSKKRLVKSIRAQENFDEKDLTNSFYGGFDWWNIN